MKVRRNPVRSQCTRIITSTEPEVIVIDDSGTDVSDSSFSEINMTSLNSAAEQPATDNSAVPTSRLQLKINFTSGLVKKSKVKFYSKFIGSETELNGVTSNSKAISHPLDSPPPLPLTEAPELINILRGSSGWSLNHASSNDTSPLKQGLKKCNIMGKNKALRPYFPIIGKKVSKSPPPVPSGPLSPIERDTNMRSVQFDRGKPIPISEIIDKLAIPDLYSWINPSLLKFSIQQLKNAIKTSKVEIKQLEVPRLLPIFSEDIPVFVFSVQVCVNDNLIGVGSGLTQLSAEERACFNALRYGCSLSSRGACVPIYQQMRKYQDLTEEEKVNILYRSIMQGRL
ncbi:hypothetical protein WICPIJ_003056 [Wickerhamomyces pijperi]|uniref:Uncharacterized protein n=1 Tax=Wickerhamomyces pijperi TaxID=599730 RepID=A0A9P8Q8D9_WICPI|nr:hypothetical protein WICPIJ_003056 [Wickerhamomyces pijperi]